MLNIKTDVLVIGGGIAGSFCVLEAVKQGQKAILASKTPICTAGSSISAAPGIQVPLGNDEVYQFIADAVVAGRWLSNQKLIKRVGEITEEGIDFLYKIGVPFNKKTDGKYERILSPRLSEEPRNLNMSIPLAGPPIMHALRRSILEDHRISIFEDVFLYDFLKIDEQIQGAFFYDIRRGDIFFIESKAVILATGTASEIYPNNMAPPTTTGDGHAIAYNNGCEIIDMEFVHFWSTVKRPTSISGINHHIESLYEKGVEPARDINGKEVNLFPSYPTSSRGSLKPILSTINKENASLSNQGGIFVNLANLKPENYWDKGIFELGAYVEKLGIKEIELGIGPLLCCGGIKIDNNCESNIDGLYAIGDAAGGFLGANYYGATGLIFAMTTGIIAGREASLKIKNFSSKQLNSIVGNKIDTARENIKTITGIRSPYQAINNLKAIMYEYAGPIRSETSLRKGLVKLKQLKKEGVSIISKTKIFNLELVKAFEFANMINVAEMVINSALERKESRGNHIRIDYPREIDDVYNIIVKKIGGNMSIKKRKVDFCIIQPGEENVCSRIKEAYKTGNY